MTICKISFLLVCFAACGAGARIFPRNTGSALPLQALEEDGEWYERFLQEVPSIVTQVPSLEPTLQPTAQCVAEVTLDCRFTMPANESLSIPCSEMPAIDQPYCQCSECAREILLQYKGSLCNGQSGCIDLGNETLDSAAVRVSTCNSDQILKEAFEVAIGDILTVSLDDTCLPPCMDITVFNAITGDPTQFFQLNTACEDRTLLLKEPYASLDFVGYTCDESNVNHCFQDVSYKANACNAGLDNLALHSLFWYSNSGAQGDMLEESAIVLSPEECHSTRANEVIDMCADGQYLVRVSANATNAGGGVPCEDEAEVDFNVIASTANPTKEPSAEPSPAPTQDCELGVKVEPECPSISCGWDRCRERPFRMEFRMDARPCAESTLRRCPGQDPDSCTCIRNITLLEEDWKEQKFECVDFNGGPVDRLAEYYVVAMSAKDEDSVYFKGVVGPGGRFNATEANEDKVDANTFLDLYEYNSTSGEPGQLLQRVLFHSSCSQQLYLLDVFGSFQLIEFESQSQLVGFGISPEVSFNISVELLEGSVLDLDFLNVVVFSENSDLLPPQITEFDVANLDIAPPYQLSTEITLIPDRIFTVIATIGGEIEDRQCFDISESLITCPGLS